MRLTTESCAVRIANSLQFGGEVLGVVKIVNVREAEDKWILDVEAPVVEDQRELEDGEYIPDGWEEANTDTYEDPPVAFKFSRDTKAGTVEFPKQKWKELADVQEILEWWTAGVVGVQIIGPENWYVRKIDLWPI